MTDEYDFMEVEYDCPEHLEDTADGEDAACRAAEMLGAITPLTPQPVRVLVADHRCRVEPSQVVWLESGWADWDCVIEVPCPGCGHILSQHSHHVEWAWEVMECPLCSGRLLVLLSGQEMSLWGKRVSVTYSNENCVCEAVVSALTSQAEGIEVVRVDRVVVRGSSSGWYYQTSSVSLIAG